MGCWDTTLGSPARALEGRPELIDLGCFIPHLLTTNSVSISIVVCVCKALAVTLLVGASAFRLANQQ